MTEANVDLRTFHLFSRLPAEIRAQIWRTACRSHITRWIRTTDEGDARSNVFNSPSRSLPLFYASSESREVVLLHGRYVLLSTSPPVWYSPVLDYLFLDARWTELSTVGLPEGMLRDPLDSLPFNLEDVKKLMIHPNYTEHRLRPGVPLERMINLEEVLIAADEKSIGFRSISVQASIYDLKKYYEGLQRKSPEVTIPYIAVACLGWVGEERIKIHHGFADNRELVAICDSYPQLKAFLNRMREEEAKFLQERFQPKRGGFMLHFRKGRSMEDISWSSSQAEPPSFDHMDDDTVQVWQEPDTTDSDMSDELPTYFEAMS